MTIDPNQFYDMNATMSATKTSRQTLYNEINAGRLNTVKRGRRRFCTGQQLIDYRKMLEAETKSGRAA